MLFAIRLSCEREEGHQNSYSVSHVGWPCFRGLGSHCQNDYTRTTAFLLPIRTMKPTGCTQPLPTSVGLHCCVRWKKSLLFACVRNRDHVESCNVTGVHLSLYAFCLRVWGCRDVHSV